MTSITTPRPAHFRPRTEALRPSSEPLANRSGRTRADATATVSVRDLVDELVGLAAEAAARSLSEDPTVRTAFGHAVEEVFGLGRTPRHRNGPPPGWVLVERAVVRSATIAAGSHGDTPAPGALVLAVADVRATVDMTTPPAPPAPRALVVLVSGAGEAELRAAAVALEGRGVTAATVMAATEPIHDQGHLLDAEVRSDHHTDQSWFVSDRRARHAAAVLQAHGIDADATVVPARLLQGAVEDRVGSGDVSSVVSVGSSGRIPLTRGWRVARHARRAGVELLTA